MTLFAELDAGPSGDPFTLTIEGTPPRSLHVVTLEGREKISQCYRFDLDLDVEIDADAVRALPGRRALLALRARTGELGRVVGGVVTRARVETARSPEGRARATVRVEPALARLRMRRGSRIFQDVRVADVVGGVLDEHGVEHAWRPSVRAHVDVHPYVVQYEETDLAFVERLLAEAGMFYWFEPRRDASEPERLGAEVLTLADAPDDYPRTGAAPGLEPGALVLSHRAASGLSEEADAIFAFGVETREHTTTATLWDFDFERPMLELRASRHEGVPAPTRESFEAASRTMLANLDGAHAARRLEARAHGSRGRGDSSARGLWPGLVFTLVDEIEPSFDGAWVVRSVRHTGTTRGEPVYRARFTCAPATTPLRPAVPERRPVQVAETAIVTGPAGEAVHVDPYGRVKVRFPWDRSGRTHDRTSAWLRVAQPWAGAGFGVQALPRVGSEVLVTFLGGDPDRPVVVGGLHNRVAQPPFSLPADRTKSGLRSQSVGGSGFSELSFEDAGGRERVHLRAERDLETWVGADERRQVARAEDVHVGGVRSLHVGLDEAITVGQERSISVGGSQSTHVSGDERTRIGGSSRHVVDGARVVTAGGPVELEGACFSARGAEDATLEAGGDVRIRAGSRGTGEVDVSGQSGVRLSSPERVVIEGARGVELSCGGARLLLTPELVELVADKIHALAAESAFVAGGPNALELGEGAQVRATEVLLLGEGASLELAGGEARLRGAQVALGAAERGSDDGARDDDPERRRIRFRFVERGHPLARKHAHVVAAGERIQTTTNGDGWLTARVRRAATRAEVTLWMERYPTGLQRRWDLLLVDELPAPETPEGARVRLHALGYEVGLYAAEPWPAFEHALRTFQERHRDSHALEPTGELDEATARALREVHGA